MLASESKGFGSWHVTSNSKFDGSIWTSLSTLNKTIDASRISTICLDFKIKSSVFPTIVVNPIVE